MKYRVKMSKPILRWCVMLKNPQNLIVKSSSWVFKKWRTSYLKLNKYFNHSVLLKFLPCCVLPSLQHLLLPNFRHSRFETLLAFRSVSYLPWVLLLWCKKGSELFMKRACNIMLWKISSNLRVTCNFKSNTVFVASLRQFP